jgi:UDP-N-acetylmuramate--alanine ligase
VGVALFLEVPFAKVVEGLAAFTGVDRRFQLKGEQKGVLVIDDYGHHPTEIRATLEALARRAGGRRTVVLFQPHRYTRTKHLWEDFTRAFHMADVLLLADIYPAGEAPIPGISSEALAAEMQRLGHRKAEYVGDLKSAADRLLEEVKPGDVVLTLGAGSVYTLGDQLLKTLEARA